MKESKESNKKTTTKKTTTNKAKADGVKKTTVRKTAVKKAVPKVEKSTNLNETINSPKEVQPVVVNDANIVECKYCHERFEKGYTICPHCHKRLNSSVSLTFFIVFALAFLFGILVFHFTDKFLFSKTSPDYKDTCILVDYESLVRRPKDYKGKDVKIIAEVKSVQGFDTGFSNDMTLTVNAHLFEDSSEHLITVTYSDKNYDQGFIEGDIITIYGNYSSINGNVPNIDAKYIVYGK